MCRTGKKKILHRQTKTHETNSTEEFSLVVADWQMFKRICRRHFTALQISGSELY